MKGECYICGENVKDREELEQHVKSEHPEYERGANLI